MNKKISLLLLGILIVVIVNAALPEEYILLEINYKDNAFSLIDKSLEKGKFPTLNHEIEPYKVQLVDVDYNAIFSSTFDHTVLYSDGFVNDETEGGAKLLDETTFFLAIPSVREGQKIEILKDNIKVFEEEVYDVGATPCRIQ